MKMNLSMEFLKPLTGTLKKYTALLPSVVITVVALLLFLPIMMVSGKVKAQMENSVRAAKRVQQLSSKVPSKEVPRQLEIRMDKLESEAEKIKQLAMQSSRRDFVTYDYVIFPEPQDQSSQLFTIFGEKYRAEIESLIKKMHALDAPSNIEIGNATGKAKKTMQGMRDFGVPMTAYSAGVDAEDPMVEALCLRRAKEISVYGSPSAFLWYDFWEKYDFTTQDQALEDCWDSQVAMWIYEDVVDTIVKMNGTGSDVLSSPVKRLSGISFSGPVITGSQRSLRYTYSMGGVNQSRRDIPNYVTPTLQSHFMHNSPTGRICDEDIDVIHFAVSVLVDNRFAFSFMKELCSEKPHVFYSSVFEEPFVKKDDPAQARHNQITILQSDVKTVDKNSTEHQFYRYGKGAVMQLDLICEYQFNRGGYDKIKPSPVKERLGQSVETQGQTPGTGSGMGFDGMPLM